MRIIINVLDNCSFIPLVPNVSNLLKVPNDAVNRVMKSGLKEPGFEYCAALSSLGEVISLVPSHSAVRISTWL